MVKSKAKTVFTKAEAIEEIIKDVHNWDLENITNFAQEMWSEQLKKLSLEEIESELNHTVGTYDTDNPDEDYLKVIDTKASRLLIDGVKK